MKYLYDHEVDLVIIVSRLVNELSVDLNGTSLRICPLVGLHGGAPAL